MSIHFFNNIFTVHSLKFRVIAVLIVTLGLLLAFHIYYISPIIKNNRIDDSMDFLQGIANQISGNLDFSYQQAILELEEIAKLPSIASMDKKQVDKTISEMNKITQFFNYYFVLDTQGTWFSYPTRPYLVGQAILEKNMGWVHQTIKRDTTISLDAVNAVIGKLVSGFATPIHSHNGELVGLLRGVIVLSEENALIETLRNVQIGKRGFAFIVSSKGLPLAHPQMKLDIEDLNLNDFSEYLPVKNVIAGESGLAEYNYEGEVWVAAYRTILTTGWGVIVQQPKYEIINQAQEEITFINLLFIIAILTAVLVLTLIIRFALRPLSQLIQSIKTGHFTELKSFPKDEIGQLARKFNTLYSALLQSKITLQKNEEKLLQSQKREDIKINTSLDPSLGLIKADPVQIEQVIINLVVNARDAMRKGGEINIKTKNELVKEYGSQFGFSIETCNYVLLSVSDTGRGIDEKSMKHIFEPFFTTKEKGTGLGLATIYGIIKQSGGHISVESKVGKGTTFNTYIPRLSTTAKQSIKAKDNVKPSGGTETVLIVEDEKTVRNMVSTVLKSFGYSVFEAENGKDALAIFERVGKNPIELIITDVIMPEMSGSELIKKLLQKHSNMKVIYISGYTDDAIGKQGVLDERIPFLQKPFTPYELADKVRRVLDNTKSR